MLYLFVLILLAAGILLLRRASTNLSRRAAGLRAPSGDPREPDVRLEARMDHAAQIERMARIVRWASVALVPVLILITFAAGFHAVPAGRVGVVYQFGAIVGQIGEGPQWVLPWRTVRQENTQVQSHPFERMACFSKESQAVYIDCTLNTRVSERAVQKLYREVGPDWFEKLVLPRVPQYFKDETVKYSTVDIAPNREEIRHVVSQRLNTELSVWSIETPDLLLNNIDFEAGFKDAIEKKQIATQRALEEEQRVKIVEFQAAQALARARGKADSLFTIAERQAEANAKLNATLSQQLIQYTMVQKLAPNVNVALLPAGQQFILGSDLIQTRRP